MLKKRISIYLLIAFLLIGVSYTNLSSIAKGKLNGKYRAQDGILVSEQSELEKKNIAETDDTTENKFKSQPDREAIESDLETKKNIINKDISFIDDFGIERKLHFAYTDGKQKKIFLDTNNADFYKIHKVPQHDRYILEFNGSLYDLKLEDGLIKQILNDPFPYTKEELWDMSVKQSLEGYILTLGENPNFNLSGTKMVFVTNRGSVMGGNFSETIVKDLASGEEVNIGSIGYYCVGWDNKNNPYFIDFDNNLVMVNLENKNRTILRSKIYNQAIMVYPNLIIQNDKGNIIVDNLDTNEKRNYKYKDWYVIDGILLSPNGECLLISSMYESGNIQTELTILNIKTNKLSKLKAPHGAFFSAYSWVDDNSILITTLKKDTLDEESIVYSIDEFTTDVVEIGR